MSAVIAWLARKVPWVKLAGVALLAVAAVAAALYVVILRADLRAATAERDAAQAGLETALAANAETVRALDALQAENARIAKVAAAESKKALSRAREVTALKEAVRHAPPTDDAPVAPVLDLALRRLFEFHAAGGGDASAGGASGRPR